MAVDADTVVAVKRKVVVERAGNVTVVAVPLLFNAGTVTVDPSENVKMPAVTWSLPFGRSYKKTR